MAPVLAPGGNSSGRSGAGDHAVRPGDVLGEFHHVLSVLVAHDLLDRRLDAGCLALQAGAQRAQPSEPEHLGLDVQPGEALPIDRDRLTPPFGADQVEQIVRRRPVPHIDPADDSETRSLASVTLASFHPSPSSPTRYFAGSRTSSKNVWLNEWAVVMSTIGLRVIPGRSIGTMKYEMPLCFGHVGIGSGDQDPEL